MTDPMTDPAPDPSFGPAPASDAAVEAVARAGYERCHPDDSFADLIRRARFSKDDRGLLRQWRDYGRALLSRGDGCAPPVSSRR